MCKPNEYTKVTECTRVGENCTPAMEFPWFSHGRVEHLPMPLLDVVPPYTIRSRENLLAALRAGARTRGTSRCTPPPCHHTRSVRPRRPSPHCLPHGTPMPAPPCHHTRIRSRETPPNVLPILPALRTRARPLPRSSPRFARKRGRAPAARGLFYWVQRDKKENIKAPPTFVLRRCSSHPPFFKKSKKTQKVTGTR